MAAAPPTRYRAGIAFVQSRIAEQVGGGLRIESAPGIGTTVQAVAGLKNEWL